MIALITGITGQDGSYLAELLLEKGYEVHGLIRRSSSHNTGRIDHILDRLQLHYGDGLDTASLLWVLNEVRPNEIYNLASQSHVQVSTMEPVYTSDIVGIGCLRLLEAVSLYQRLEWVPTGVRVYQASSSEQFGNQGLLSYNEHSSFLPCSPYGIAKTFAHHMSLYYRTRHSLDVSCGILFNHESPRRGETFVTRKTTRAVGRIVHGLQDKLILGNLDARRDWGHAKDYVRAMWLMLQQEVPGDYVIASGQTYSVRDFCEEAFSSVGRDYRKYVTTDALLMRPIEIDTLRGDSSKAMTCLQWKPTISFQQMVEEMVEADLLLAEREAHG